MSGGAQLSTSCLSTHETKYCADVVECCPHEGHQNILVCGTYELDEAAQQRVGGFYTVKYDEDSDRLVWNESKFKETSGIFDAKWCHTSPLLATAHANGCISIWQFDDATSTLSHVQEISVDNESEGASMCLSLDWSDRLGTSRSRRLAVSSTNGKVAIYTAEEAHVCPDPELEINAHVLKIAPNMYLPSEVWICGFDYWDPSVLWTGGDDGSFKLWDTRESSKPMHVGNHGAGVCSMQCNFHIENLMATGGYDSVLNVSGCF
eukprot:gb/GECG01010191.1/.p1 GENE.gb/GECG01010191.1/~~gb/GECG01010191.1/.p1  ORF type:complete len:263 (+),score=23.56 gb/GECG01010191.1/:1-789(+)